MFEDISKSTKDTGEENQPIIREVGHKTVGHLPNTVQG